MVVSLSLDVGYRLCRRDPQPASGQGRAQKLDDSTDPFRPV